MAIISPSAPLAESPISSTPVWVITQPYRHGGLGEILSHTPGDGRGHIRLEDQCVVVTVEKFKHLPGSDASPLLVENIKILERRCLDILIPVEMKHLADLVLNRQLGGAFPVIEVPDSLRGVQ